MVLIETSFPRGGTIKKLEEPKQIVFGARQAKEQKKKKPKKPKDDKESHKKVKETELRAVSAELLSRKTIQEGMIIMGSVRKVDPIYLLISLPGRLVGKVVASNVSDSYTDMLNKYVDNSEFLENFRPLTEMYHVGQVVYAKVLEIKADEHRKLQIVLSLKPSDVHSNMHHEKISKGMVFNGAVQEAQEHGYVMETGVKNLRCFLPAEKSPGAQNVGQLVFLKVEKITHASNASTAICSAVKDDNRKIKDLIDPNMDYIFPSTVVRFTITNILKNGLQGTIMNGIFKAYVNEHQLSDPLANPKDYEVNSTVNARLLYIMPLSKLIYLSLNLKLVPKDEKLYQTGDIVEAAKIQRIGTGGVILNLDDKAKGLISFKTIRAGITGNYDHDDVLSKYTKNKKLKVRIVEYDEMDSMYICSDNSWIVNEKYYTIKDLKVADFITAKIKGRDPTGGYYVGVGRVRGLIEKIYLAPTSLNLQQNAKLNCRVISVNANTKTLNLTNRPEYMAKNSRLLTDISQAKEKKVFIGTIVKVSSMLLLVKFCNNIKGVLYKSKITGHMANEISSFYEGQTMPFRIISRQDEKIILGLEDESHEVGDVCRAKINSTIESGLDITINDDDHMKGLVPTRFLSDFPHLAEAKLRAMNPNDTIEVSCIVQNIYSVRDVKYFHDNLAKHWTSVQPGDILRGFIKSVKNDIVEIFLPIKDFQTLIKIHIKMFLQVATKNYNIVVYPDQVIYVKVLSKEVVTKNITISAKLADVWDCDLEAATNMMVTYIEELNHIKASLKARENPLGNLELGEKIEAKLLSYDDETEDMFVELENGVRGIIKSTFNKKGKRCELGISLKCVIVWIDYLNEIVYLCKKQSLVESIVKVSEMTEKTEKRKKPRYLESMVIVKTNDIMLCSTKVKNNPLFFVPTKLHYNDFEETMGTGIKEGDKCRIRISHKSYPIALLHKYCKIFKNKNNVEKRKHPDGSDGVAPKKVKKDNYENDLNDILTEYKEINLQTLNEMPSGKSRKRKLSESTANSAEITLSEESSNDEDDMIEFLKGYETKLQKLNELPTKISKAEKLSGSKTPTDDAGKIKKILRNKTEIPIPSEELSSDEDDMIEFLKDYENMLQTLSELPATVPKDCKEKKPEPIKSSLSGASGFWSTVLPTVSKSSEQNAAEESSSDDDEDDKALAGDKKKEELPLPPTASKDHKEKKPEPIKPALPGASGFWSADLQTVSKSSEKNAAEESSNDDDEDDKALPEGKKKKKLTASERFRAAREEEARLREIEEKLANPNIQPETADQFDRLVLANPNSSKTWIEYMVFHLTAAEIDKARTVARKALKAISFREEQELINIWVALLNLELRYGTKESFNEILKESLICNDPYKVYIRAIQILTDSQKTQELSEMITTVIKKFKDKTETWRIAANAYFEIGLAEKAKKLLNKALSVLPERDHINTIVMFANLNYKHGDKETAHTLLEQILTSYPKRVDVWSQYVDMLIKDNEIDSARKTLERAVIQKIPLKKMRTLFKKYIEFEQRYGTQENVENVKQMATNYVQKEINT